MGEEAEILQINGECSSLRKEGCVDFILQRQILEFALRASGDSKSIVRMNE